MGAGWRKARSPGAAPPSAPTPACLALLRSAALALGDSPRRLRDLAARRGVFLRFFPTGFLAAPNGGGVGSDSGGRGEAERQREDPATGLSGCCLGLDRCSVGSRFVWWRGGGRSAVALRCGGPADPFIHGGGRVGLRFATFLGTAAISDITDGATAVQPPE